MPRSLSVSPPESACACAAVAAPTALSTPLPGRKVEQPGRALPPWVILSSPARAELHLGQLGEIVPGELPWGAECSEGG